MSTDNKNTSAGGLSTARIVSLGEQLAIPISVMVVLGLWSLAAAATPSYIFPTIPELLTAILRIFSSSGEFSVLDNYGMTLARVFLATAFCLVAGIVCGILMGTSDRADDHLFVYILGTFAFPSVIWAFLAVIWFGLTKWFVAVFTVFMIVAPYVAITIKEGIEELDSDLTEMAESFDASTFLVWQNIYIPHLYPHIFASTRLTVTLAWKITLIAEIFGSQLGLGEIINFYFTANQNDMIIAWVLPMMALMFLVGRGLRRIEAERFSWRDASKPTQAA